jgi:death-on-curing protein
VERADPVFLGLDECLEIHRDQIARYGGSPGVRGLGLLESALAMPQAGFGGVYLHADLFEMAAAYLFHLVKNHAFVDGDKRAGAMVTYVFLRLNGVELTAGNAAFERLVLGVAEGKVAKEGIARFLRKHSRRAGR